MVVISFPFVLGTNRRIQPVVMAPNTLSIKHYRLHRKISEVERRTEEGARENQKTRGRYAGLYNLSKKEINIRTAEPRQAN